MIENIIFYTVGTAFGLYVGYNGGIRAGVQLGIDIAYASLEAMNMIKKSDTVEIVTEKNT